MKKITLLILGVCFFSEQSYAYRIPDGDEGPASGVSPVLCGEISEAIIAKANIKWRETLSNLKDSTIRLRDSSLLECMPDFICKNIENYSFRIGDIVNGCDLAHLERAGSVAIRLSWGLKDEDLFHLRYTPNVELSQCPKITDAGLGHLATAEVVKLESVNITDAGLEHLATAKVLKLFSVHGVKGPGLAHLKNVEELTVIPSLPLVH